jgi:hypothetical protein
MRSTLQTLAGEDKLSVHLLLMALACSSDNAAASLAVYSTLRLAMCLLAAAVSVVSNCAALPCTLQLGTCFWSNKARMLVSRLMPSHADVLSNCLETSRSRSLLLCDVKLPLCLSGTG